MAGYFIYSIDADVLEQLTTSPTKEQALILADSLLDDFGLEDALEEYEEEGLVDPSKWPLDREALADRIRERLALADWYADLAYNDTTIWDNGLLYEGLAGEAGEELGIDFQAENNGELYWDAAETAARRGASMMDGSKFGNSGFRYSGKSKGDIDVIYSFYLPAETQALLKQLELVAPHFETLPDEEGGEREQFFLGLLEPVRKIVEAGRVMWVQTDT